MAEQRGRFQDVDFSVLEIEHWTPELDVDSRGFRCSRGEFRTFWTGNRITREVTCYIGKCWILRAKGKLAGYITLLADKLQVDGLLQSEGVQYPSFPAVKIGLLAADERARGAGTALVKWALAYVATDIAPALGVRFVTVDALFDPDTGYDVSPFYANKLGFMYADPDEVLPPAQPFRTLYFDLKPLLDVLYGEGEPTRVVVAPKGG